MVRVLQVSTIAQILDLRQIWQADPEGNLSDTEISYKLERETKKNKTGQLTKEVPLYRE